MLLGITLCCLFQLLMAAGFLGSWLRDSDLYPHLPRLFSGSMSASLLSLLRILVIGVTACLGNPG